VTVGQSDDGVPGQFAQTGQGGGQLRQPEPDRLEPGQRLSELAPLAHMVHGQPECLLARPEGGRALKREHAGRCTGHPDLVRPPRTGGEICNEVTEPASELCVARLGECSGQVDDQPSFEHPGVVGAGTRRIHDGDRLAAAGQSRRDGVRERHRSGGTTQLRGRHQTFEIVGLLQVADTERLEERPDFGVPHRWVEERAARELHTTPSVHRE